jgi:hypothetical protein
VTQQCLCNVAKWRFRSDRYDIGAHEIVSVHQSIQLRRDFLAFKQRSIRDRLFSR